MDSRECYPIVTSEVSERLRSAVSQVCTLKVDMDHRFGMDKCFGQLFVDDWMGSHNTSAYWGSTFLAAILPFIDWETTDTGPAYQGLVDPKHVLGASIKGLPRNIEGSDVAKRIAEYSGFNGPLSEATYLWYKPLGLFVAHEGKHRVAFMRAHNQQLVAAWIKERSYPSADRIQIIEPPKDHEHWLCILDGRYLQVMASPRVGRFLLEAYGVSTLRWSQIKGLPPENVAWRRLRELNLDLPPKTTDEPSRTLDLNDLRDELRVRNEEDTAQVFASSWHVQPWSIDTRRFIFPLIILLGSAATPMVAPVVYAKSIGMACFGIALGMLYGSTAKWFVTTKRLRRKTRSLF